MNEPSAAVAAEPEAAPPGAVARAEAPVDRETWAARFGWITGAVLGTLAGFALTFVLELWVLKGRVADATGLATRLSSGIVPALFIAGALGGHALGARGGAARYRLLGAAAGISLAAAAWVFLVLTR